MATAGGVAFLTATMDDYIRAFDVTTGKMLWQSRLPAAGGHGSFHTKLGDYIVAYTLGE